MYTHALTCTYVTQARFLRLIDVHRLYCSRVVHGAYNDIKAILREISVGKFRKADFSFPPFPPHTHTRLAPWMVL